MNFHSKITAFDKQLEIGSGCVTKKETPRHTNGILVVGMGGSILPGYILQMKEPTTRLHSDYDLPQDLSGVSLVICISWSGNTEETISAYTAAIIRGLRTICITTGGKLSDLAEENNTTLIKLPAEDLQPRFALGIMTGALFGLLGLREHLPRSLIISESEQTGKNLSDKIGSKIPLIYSGGELKSLGHLWKVLFNENAKIHSFNNSLPDLAHNELAGFNNNNRSIFHPIILTDKSGSDPRQNHDLNALLAILDGLEYNYSTIELSGKNLLEKILNNYILGLWTSCYLAINLGVDPEDTAIIERFKKLKK